MAKAQPPQMHMDKYIFTSCVVAIAACVDAVGGVLGLWSVTAGERAMILALEAVMLTGLLANSYALMRWVHTHSASSDLHRVALLSFVSLALCTGGDLVNFNLPETYYRHGSVVKHDYLADSVTFFAPGYLLLLVAVCLVARHRQLRLKIIAGVLTLGALIGGLSFASMHLPGTGIRVSAITGTYAMLISALGASGLLLLFTYGGLRAPRGVWLVTVGVVLAAIADGVIGQFWIYGNGGEGYFPTVRYVNWMIYAVSQCLVIHLARVAVWSENP